MASCEGAKETTRGKEDRREGVYSTFPRLMMSDSSARPVGRTPKLMIFPRERETAEGRGNGGKRLGLLHPILHLLFIAQLHSDHGKAKKRRDIFLKRAVIVSRSLYLCSEGVVSWPSIIRQSVVIAAPLPPAVRLCIFDLPRHIGFSLCRTSCGVLAIFRCPTQNVPKLE